MLKNVIVIVVFSLFILSCNGIGEAKPPDNLISKDKMGNILFDLYVVNAAKGVNRKTLEKNGLDPETYILTKYNIDSSQFASSNAYYAHDIDVYQGIVDKVKARIEKEKKFYQDIKKSEDSLKIINDSLALLHREPKKIIELENDQLNVIRDKKNEMIKKTIDSIGSN